MFLLLASWAQIVTAQNPVTNVIPIIPYYDTWDYPTAGGKGRACGYYLYGRFPAYLEYTFAGDYEVEGRDSLGHLIHPSWKKAVVLPYQDFVFGVGGSWTVGPATSVNCPPTPSLGGLGSWTATLVVEAPNVSFGYVESATDPGQVKFVSFSTDPRKKKLEFLWNFGDGATDTFTAPTHQYEKPGEYKVILRATNPAGAYNTATNTVIIKPPELSVALSFVGRKDTHPSLGETVTARAVVNASRHGLGSLANVAYTTTEALGIPEVFELVEAPESLVIGTMKPGDTHTNEWKLKVVNAGKFNLQTSAVRGTDIASREVIGPGGELPGDVSGLNVEVTFFGDPLQLKKKKQEPGELSSNPGYEPATMPVRVKVSVPENGKPVENITLVGYEMSDGGLNMKQVIPTGNPEQPWVLVTPQPAPFPLTVTAKPSQATQPGPLRAGDKPLEFDFVVEAERPGNFEWSTLFTAKQVGASTVLQERGSKVRPVLGDLVLAVQLDVVNDPLQIKEGEAVEVSGLLKNLTDRETVLLDPVHVINLGQGAALGPIENTSSQFPPFGLLSIYAPILEPTGDKKEARFRVRMQTTRLPGLDQRVMIRRQAVALDFDIGGQVVGEDGAVRDLAPENIVVEWGRGSYSESGTTYLSVPVEPNLLEPREISWSDFALRLYGNAFEAIPTGMYEVGQEGLYNAYAFLASLPDVAWSLKNFAQGIAAEQSETFMRQARYQAAMEQWMVSTYTGVSPETYKKEVDEVSAEIAAYYGRKAKSGDAIKAAVNNGITSFFRKLLDAKDRAWEHDYEFNAETAQLMTSWIKPTTKVVVGFVSDEAVEDLAVGMFLSRCVRSRRIADDVVVAAEKQAAKDAKEVEEAIEKSADGLDPSLKPAPKDLRNLRGGAKLTQSQAIRAYAVDKVTDNNLIDFTKNMPVFVAVRSRADETLEWMKSKLGMTPKGVKIKQKNVNNIDEAFLEYRQGVGYGDSLGRGGGDRGSVILAEPIPPAVLEGKLVGASPEVRKEVVERYRLRWEEWYGDGSLPADPNALPFDTTLRPGAKSAELKARASAATIIGDGTTTQTKLVGSIEMPKRGSVPDPSINSDVDEIHAGANFEPRALELRQVIDPPGNEHFGGRVREYYEVWVEDDPLGPAETARGVLKRVAGDVDSVIVGDVAGYKLGRSPRLATYAKNRGINAYGNLVAETLQRIMKAQHPWSSSLIPDKMRAKFLGDHIWHKDLKLRGEPLLVYVNGERRIAWFDPSKNIDPENPLAALVFLQDGGNLSVEDVVRQQWEGRNLLPKPEEKTPKVIRTSVASVRQAMINNDYIDKTALIATCAVGTSRASGAALYRLSALDQLEKREPDGHWAPAFPETECKDGGVVVVPEAVLAQDVVAGVLRLPILNDLLGPNWTDLFKIGDQIIVAPGTGEEELNVVANYGSLILARPTRFDHPAGTLIALVPPQLPLTGALATPPTIWLQADAGLELDGTNVVSWTDQAAGTRFVNPEGGRDGLPFKIKSDLGMTAVHFKGDEWIMGGIARQLTNATIFCLSRFNTTTSSGRDYIYSIGSPGSAGSMMTLGRRGDDAYHYDGRTIYSPAETLVPGGSWQVLTQVYGDGDTRNHKVYLNGGMVFESKSAASYNVDASRIFLGNYESGSFFFDGDITEWMLFDRLLSAEERAAVEKYLKDRGGLHQPSEFISELVLTIQPATAGGWVISWTGEIGKQYQLEASNDLQTGSWSLVKTITATQSGPVSIDIVAERLSAGFYRLRTNGAN